MITVPMFKQGEHVYMELEIEKVILVGAEHKYRLKVPGVEDYLKEEYVFDQLIPIDVPAETEKGAAANNEGLA